MADLILNEDRKQYQDLARDFAQNEIAPKAQALDHEAKFPLDICKKAWEIGLFNTRFPEELGGLALGALDSAVIAEELGAACAAVGTTIVANEIAAAPLLVAGTDEQKKKYLEPMTTEFALAGLGLTNWFMSQPGAGLVYQKSSDGIVLHGQCTGINVGHAKFIVCVASSKDDKNRSMFFAIPLDAAGIKVGERVPALGLKAADIHVVNFDSVKVGADATIGNADQATQLMQETGAIADVLIAALAVGVSRSALENSVRYSKERQTMGKPIGNHQAVGFMLADIAKDAEAGRLLTHKAAWLIDEKDVDCKQASVAKSFATAAAMRGATDAVQVYGGYGYSREYPVEKLMRDAKSMQVYFANCEENKLALGQQLVGAGK